MDSVAVIASSRVVSSWPWYLTRASGLVAAFTLGLLVLTGVGMVSGYEFKLMEPLKAWANHRTLGIVFTISLLVHVLSLLFDKFVSFNIVQVLVPFASGYGRITIWGLHVGSLGVALGILAFYLMVAVMWTSLTKTMDKHRTLWSWTHLLSYLMLAAVFFHSVMIGTDLKGFWRLIWYAANALVAWAILIRIHRAGALKSKKV